MPDYQIQIKRSALKEIAALPKFVGQRIVAAIDDLARIQRPVGYKKIRGELDQYRIRVGNYRVIYLVQDENILVVVVRVAHRKDVYS